MNFHSRIPIWRFLLFPFALLYGGVIHIRNFLFDKGLLRTQQFDFPLICIGNLSVGGTGKTPMTEMLLDYLEKHHYAVATLSRGYKRKTKGFLVADAATSAVDIGDEPMQFHRHFPDVLVTVGEDRAQAIRTILRIPRTPDVIVLDDALQHRKVKARLNILLTDYSHLYPEDYFLPVGSLRDQRSSARRADVIVVTKCPPALDLKERNALLDKIKPASYQQVFFSAVTYGAPYPLFPGEKLDYSHVDRITAIAGIAKPKPYFEYLRRQVKEVMEVVLPDHHNLTEKEIDKIFSAVVSSGSKKNAIFMITEKDAPRFLLFEEKLRRLSTAIYVLPIKSVILHQEAGAFYEKITSVINNR